MIQSIDELCNRIAAGHSGIEVTRLSKGVRIGRQIFNLQPDPYSLCVRLSMSYGYPTTPGAVEQLCAGAGNYLLGFMAMSERLAHEAQPGDVRYFIGLGPLVPDPEGHAFLTELGFKKSNFTGWVTEYTLGEKYACATLVLPWNKDASIRVKMDEKTFAASRELRRYTESMRRLCELCELLERTLGRPVNASGRPEPPEAHRLSTEEGE